MSLVKQLRTKPWLPVTDQGGEQRVIPQGEKRVALRFFLLMVTVFFSLFLVTFLSRSQYPDFQALAGQPWQPLTDRSQLWFNSAMLLCASIFLEMSKSRVRQQRLNHSVFWLALALLMSIQFLFAQVSIWQQLNQLGFYSAANPANSFYYLLTGLHGLHLLGGMVVMAAALLHVARHVDAQAFETSVSLCATYWHYLLGLWLLLFALLSSSAETFRTIAVICGYG